MTVKISSTDDNYNELLLLIPYKNKKVVANIKEIIVDSLLTYKLHDYKLNQSDGTASFIIERNNTEDISDVITDIIDTYGILAEDTWKGADLSFINRGSYEEDEPLLDLKLVSIYGIMYNSTKLQGWWYQREV